MTGKDIIKITFSLVIIYMVGGLILAMVYAKTSPIIFKNNEKAKQEALKQLMPDADAILKAGDWTIHDKHAEYFEAKKGGETIGYVVQSFGKGYSSYIDTLISVNRDFIVQKINILHHAETPGLGDEIELDYFKDRLSGKDVDHLKVLKTETTEYVEAISGATISTRAVTEDAVKNGVLHLIKTMREGNKEGEEKGHVSGGHS